MALIQDVHGRGLRGRVYLFGCRVPTPHVWTGVGATSGGVLVRVEVLPGDVTHPGTPDLPPVQGGGGDDEPFRDGGGKGRRETNIQSGYSSLWS